MASYYRMGAEINPVLDPPPDYNSSCKMADNQHRTNMKEDLIPDSFSGPVIKRSKTNVEFLYLMIIFIGVWLTLVMYCMANGDLHRIFNSHDDSISTDDTMKALARSISQTQWEIYQSCVFALGFSTVLIMLFRHFAGFIIWFVLGLCITICVVGSAVLWIRYSQESSRNMSENDRYDDSPVSGASASYFIGAVSLTIFTIIICLILYAMRKNIKLVVRLFIEAGKAVQKMPLVILQPFITIGVLLMFCSLWVYFAIWIESSGLPQRSYESEQGTLYAKNEVMQFTRVYNVIAFIWITQFIIGCQHLVIAGAVAKWYFTRDKSNLRSPLSTSYSYLFKYHLGSVAMGSLIITIVKIIRFLYRTLSSRTLFRGVLKFIERFVVFLTRNAYIEVAIFGDGFWTSGKRAFDVLTSNVAKVATINSVGDFVMFLGKVVVAGCTTGVGFWLLQDKRDSITDCRMTLYVIAFFSYMLAHSFMTAFEMTVDTIFVCFCEDCDLHKSDTEKYFMSNQLKKFIEKDAGKVLRTGDAMSSTSGPTRT